MQLTGTFIPRVCYSTTEFLTHFPVLFLEHASIRKLHTEDTGANGNVCSCI
jgi:hypothetical protein